MSRFKIDDMVERRGLRGFFVNMRENPVVWKLRGKLKPDGSLFVFYLAAYSVGRFLIASSRDPGSQGTILFGWLIQAQLIAVLVGLVIIPLLIARTRWNSRQSITENGASGNPVKG